MTQNPPEAAERYTSYHSDNVYSIFDKVWGQIKRKKSFDFEYNGIPYSVGFNPAEKKWTLFSHEPMHEYLMPWWPGKAGTVTEFSDDAVDEFITAFEIEGKTVEWILNHQKEWKYKFSAAHLEKVLTGFSFVFVYRKTPCKIYRSGHRSGPDPKDPFVYDGRYFCIWMDNLFDPTRYAPSRRGEKHWSMAGFELGIWDFAVSNDPANIRYTEIGPFKTDGELLDTIRLNDKTLRELFDTEYDDRDVLCGEFDG